MPNAYYLLLIRQLHGRFIVFNNNEYFFIFALINVYEMKRDLLSLVFLILITTLLCGLDRLIASNKAGTLIKQQDAKPGFIENKEQIIDQNNKLNPAVLYLLNTPGMNVQLRKGGALEIIAKPTLPQLHIHPWRIQQIQNRWI